MWFNRFMVKMTKDVHLKKKPFPSIIFNNVFKLQTPNRIRVYYFNILIHVYYKN